MRFLEYLFFKYYYWQIKVGNGDMPTFMSIFSITVLMELYFIDIIAFYFYFIAPIGTSFIKISVLAVMFILFFILLYFLFGYHGKGNVILDKHQDEWKGKKNLGAILFPITAFVIFVGENYIKMLMNRGVL